MMAQLRETLNKGKIKLHLHLISDSTGELVELVHALHEAHRVIVGEREHAEAEVAVLWNLRRDVGGELDRVAVPGAAEVMLREPGIVAELGGEQGL